VLDPTALLDALGRESRIVAKRTIRYREYKSIEQRDLAAARMLAVGITREETALRIGVTVSTLYRRGIVARAELLRQAIERRA
jgi:hypothetical protein